MKNSSYPTFEQVRAFLLVAEHESFSAAAKEINTTQASISRNIASLEEVMGEPLLYRTTRTLQMTESGVAFKENAHDLLQIWQASKLRVANQAQTLKGAIKFAAPQLFAEQYIAKCLPRFLNSHPQLSVQLSITEERESLLERGYDLVVRSGDLDDSSLYFQPACRSRLVMVASPKFLEKFPPIKHPSDLPLENCLVFRKDSEWRFKNGKDTIVVNPRCRFNTTNASLMNRLINEGFGIAISPLWIVSEAIKKRRLIPLLGEYELLSELKPYCEVNFLYPTRRPPKKVQILMDFIRLQVESDNLR